MTWPSVLLLNFSDLQLCCIDLQLIPCSLPNSSHLSEALKIFDIQRNVEACNLQIEGNKYGKRQQTDNEPQT